MEALAALLLIFAISLAAFIAMGARRDRRARRALEEDRARGLGEPATLHPVFDPVICIGTEACVPVCPEGDVIGIVNGRGTLVHPSRCIGHGACASACPEGAIALVFGTRRRGVELPHVEPDFETNVPGLFIAGELGGMGLIRNAVEQGRQAVAGIAARVRASAPSSPAHPLDLVIVGAGPAGLSASLTAQSEQLRFETFEQDRFGGAVLSYPRQKLINSAPFRMPHYGRIPVRELSKEELLQIWSHTVLRSGLRIRERERVEAVERVESGFRVVTARAEYATRHVLLAIGRHGSPRKLDVEGEDLPHVTYALVEPERVRSQTVVVVGGGNAALEAALRLADPSFGNRVTLVHRGAHFGRASVANREQLESCVRDGTVRLRLDTTVERIGPGRITVRSASATEPLRADRVFVRIGGRLAASWLQGMGVHIETRFGTAAGDPDPLRSGGARSARPGTQVDGTTGARRPGRRA
ncbi:MAG: NAD(P)-binding domain-containing protein [Deltaproteobacteria bacterium]|nr:MAG: NAD(P)-binding domain-containing protein [Deltaproteobacteria bacterium]